MNSPIATFSPSPSHLDVIRRGPGKDCNQEEFDRYIEMARRHGLDPLAEEIYALVFNKNNPEKRQLAIVVAIDGYRNLAYRGAASRGQEIRPGDPCYVIRTSTKLKDDDTNPKGIRNCKVTWHVRDTSQVWHDASLQVDWDEFVPLEEIWERDQDQGKRVPTGSLAIPRRSEWRRQPKNMISKCAEAQLLRRLAPELKGLKLDTEFDRMSAWDQAEQASADRRLERAHVKDTISLILGDDLQAIPIGQVADSVLAEVGKLRTPEEVDAFTSRNRIGLREFWGQKKDDFFLMKVEIEKARDLMVGGE